MSRRPRHHGRIICALACVVLMAGSGPSEAAPFTWTSSGTSPLADGSGSWNATGGTNWFDGSAYGAWGNTNADTATFGVGSGAAGTVTVGGVTTNGITLNDAGSGNYTLSSGTITMAGTTPTIAVNASGTTTLTSRLAGSAGLTKTGAGTLLLGTGNTYTGTTTLSQGTVAVTSITNTLGNGTGGSVLLDGGTLEVGAGSIAANFSPAWVITVGAGGGTLQNSTAFQWNLANSFRGAGTLTLKAGRFNANTQNNFSGKWVIDGISGGFVDYFTGNVLGTGTGDDVVSFANNGSVQMRGGTAGSATKGFTVISGTTAFNITGGSGTTTIAAKLSGPGAVRFYSSLNATLAISNTANTYTGDTLLSSAASNGKVQLTASDVLPDGAGKGNVFIFNGGAAATLNLNGFNETINGLSSLNPTSSTLSTDSIVDNLAASTSATLTVGGNDATATFAGVIRNSQSGSNAIVALSKIGSGTQTLSGDNTYWGATTINGGVLELGAGGTAGSLSGSSAVTIASGAAIAFRRSNSYDNFVNAIGGAGGVILTSGTVTFTGSNTYSGSTTVNGGVLVAGTANAFGSSSAALVINTGTASLGGFSVAAGPLSGASGGVLTTSSAAGTATFTTNVASGMSSFAGSIANNGSGVVALTKQGGGTLVFAGSNTYTGTTTIAGGAIQVSAISNSIGNGSTGPVQLDGGGIVLATTSALYPTWAVSVGSGGGSLLGSGSGGLWGISSNTISGSGTLTLQSASGFGRFQFGVGITQTGFSGKWVIDGSGGAFVDNPQGSPWGVGTGDDVITLVNNGALLMRSGTVGSATQGITIGEGGATLDGAGNITAVVAAKISSTGTAAVTFAASGNSGIVGLTNTANSYAGDTVVAGKVASSAPWFQLGAAEVIPDGVGKGNVVIINAGARGAFDLNGFSETINGLSSFNGTSLLTDSIVDNRAAGTSAVLTLGGNNASATFAGVIQNTGASATLALTKIGSGAQTLSGVNTYSGATTISGGTLALGVNGSFANSPTITVGDAGSLAAVLDVSAKSGTFSFGSGQTLGGIGTLRMGVGDTARVAGVFAPGNSPGLFTLDGGTTLLSGTTQMEIFGTVRGTGYDAVDLVNAAVLDYAGGTLFLDFGSTLAAQQSFQLFGDGSATNNGSLSAVTIAGVNYAGLTFTRADGVWTSTGTNASNQTLSFTEVTGTLVIVPEPTAVVLAGIGGILVWGLRRRRGSRAAYACSSHGRASKIRSL